MTPDQKIARLKETAARKVAEPELRALFQSLAADPDLLSPQVATA